MNSFKLLKIRAIMKRFGCNAEEAAIIKKTGVAPEPKPEKVQIVIRAEDKRKKETTIINKKKEDE